MENTFDRIKKIVRIIPKGKVTTYGTVARKAGLKDARIVGWAIRNNQNPEIPCHRVVRADGFLAEKFSLGGFQEQRRRLEKDGIKFAVPDHMLPKVDMSKYFWE
jgi:methylated-DNA-protein-cysteine methyltransferase-like protein